MEALAMKPLGIALIMAAFLLHISCCKYDDETDARIISPICARDYFRVNNNPSQYNTVLAGLFGLVIPVITIGGGIYLIQLGGRNVLFGCPRCGKTFEYRISQCSQCHGKLKWNDNGTTCRYTYPEKKEKSSPNSVEPPPVIPGQASAVEKWLLDRKTEDVSVAEDDNPRLVSCPDCGRRISKLAASCPQCGRPATLGGAPQG
jgi:hypothetical protein